MIADVEPRALADRQRVGIRRRPLAARARLRDTWDVPLCWLDDTRFVVWGHGDASMAAADIYDARTGKLETLVRRARVRASSCSIACCSCSVSRRPSGTSSAAAASCARLLAPRARPLSSGREVLRDAAARRPHDDRRLRGLDADARGRPSASVPLAASIDDPVGQLGVLGDALEDAGCTDDAMLAHCRTPGPHGRAVLGARPAPRRLIGSRAMKRLSIVLLAACSGNAAPPPAAPVPAARAARGRRAARDVAVRRCHACRSAGRQRVAAGSRARGGVARSHRRSVRRLLSVRVRRLAREERDPRR